MKSIYNYLSVSMLLILALLTTVGCSEEYDYNTDYSSYKNAKLKVELVDENNTLHLKLENEKHQVTIAIEPEDVLIDIAAYIYSLSDESVATVNQTGLITMKQAGTTDLTVRFRGNQEIAASCKIVIDPILVNELKVPESVSVQEFKTLDLAALVMVYPTNATNKAVNYSVVDESIATVDKNGIVTGVREGETQLTVTTTDGTNISKTLTLYIVAEVKVAEILLNAASKMEGQNVGVGQVFDLGSVVSIMPENASNKDLSYSIVSGGHAASIGENGVLTTLAGGDVQVKVMAQDNSGVEAVLNLVVDPATTLFERSLWTVDTSIRYSNGNNYVTDGSTGRAEDMFDGNQTTFLALVKPGKTYGVFKADALNVPLYFIVDMGAKNEFNYFKWAHRAGNTINYLRVWGVSLSGSNDGTNFTEIKANIDIPYANNTSLIEIDIPISSYRYIKVQYSKWSDLVPTSEGGSANGSTMQVGEFNVGKR